MFLKAVIPCNTSIILIYKDLCELIIAHTKHLNNNRIVGWQLKIPTNGLKIVVSKEHLTCPEAGGCCMRFFGGEKYFLPNVSLFIC